MKNEPIDIKTIFSEALEKQNSEERAAYLDRVCGSDADLRAKVEALLKAHQAAGDFLEAPVFGASVTLDSTAKIEGPGTMVGRYELLELIGEGGMGLVYLAEQKEPVKRRVALKIIKPGMGTKQVIARFEAERQALALLEHPNIAHVFDAGTTETGRPYFVMEYVKGLSINRYCDEHKLNIEQRLMLFEQVCEGVHHAHQKGIIHRDIKPSNILVSVHGDRAVPKIIDFGIAKAITQPLTDNTFVTFQGQLLGTLEYMSPEQVDLATQDIDTRSDIYSLGVVLYELLAGVLPFEKESFERAGFAEIQQTIRELEPASPSIRLTSLGEKARTIAASRGTQVITLARRLHRELEWIPLKAMRKDRCRRYRSASELADDVRNYLNGLPLIAGPETAIYRVKKFVRKHAGSVTTVLLVAVAIILGFVVSTAMYFRAEQALKREAAARAEAVAARTEAERQAKTSQAVVDFLNNDLLKPVQMALVEEQEVTGRYVFDAASESIEGKFDGEPLIEASIRQTLGTIYLSLGEYKAAEPHLERALKLHRKQLAEEHPETLRSMNNLAELYNCQRRYDESELLFVKTLELRRRVLGEEHPDTLQSMLGLAVMYMVKQERYDEAEPLCLKVLEIRRRKLGEEHPDTLTSMRAMGWLYRSQGSYDESEALYVKALEISRRVLGEEHWATLKSVNQLAQVYQEQERYDEAEALYVKALDVRRRKLGEEHPDTLQSMLRLAVMYMVKQERYDEAEPLCLKVLDIRRRKLGEEHPDTLRSMRAMGWLYHRSGRYDESETLYAKALEISRRVLGEEHQDTLKSVNNLIWLYNKQERYEEAEPLAITCYQGRSTKFGPEHAFTQDAIQILVKLYEAWGKPEKAEEWRAKLPRDESTQEQ